MEERARVMKMIDFKTSIEEEPSFYDIKIDEEGNICYYNERGEFHRLDGPAMEFAVGTKVWHANGKLHRLDGPAVEYPDGTKQWYVNGKRHRLDGPAIELANGRKEWYVNGQRHRLDGPAYEDVQGNKEWWVNGKLHRLDGPAAEFVDVLLFGNYKAWYVNGESIGKSPDGFTDEDFEKWKKEHGL